MPTDVLGPLGALVGAVIVAAALWKAHLDADKDIRLKRDEALTGWMAQTQANATMANAVADRNRRDAARARAGDKP